MPKRSRRMLASLICSASIMVGVSMPSAAQLDTPTTRNVTASTTGDSTAEAPREREAPIVVELETGGHSDHEGHDLEPRATGESDSKTERRTSTAEVQQMADVKRKVRQLRRDNNERRADAARQRSTTRRNPDGPFVPRASQTASGIFASYATPVPAGAKATIEKAVAAWGASLDVSTAPVEVEVTWTNFGGGVLGSAGPETYISHSSLPTGHWYPVAQANVLAGSDFNGPNRPEIQVELNSSVSWYTGLNGQPSGNQVDLFSVVLHEVGHGLGFLGSAQTSSGALRLLSPAFIFDRHVTHNGVRLTTIGNQAGPLTSNNLFTRTSPTATAELYAPSTWLQGTSYSHFRPTAAQASTLMTPSIQYGATKRTIDAKTLGVLRMTGWSTQAVSPVTPPPPNGPTCTVPTPNSTYAGRVANDVVGAQVWRLYSAFFLRQPLLDGYNYWRNIRSTGYPHNKISDFFAASPEFASRYGSLTNGEFVDLVYNNVLCREPEPEGRNYWMGQLQNGMSRGDLMLFFSEGQEYLGKTGTSHPLIR